MLQLVEYLKRLGPLVVGLLVLYLIDPFHTDYLFGYMLTAFVFLKKNFLLRQLDGNFLLLAFFSVTYALFYSFNLYLGSQYIVIYIFFPLGFYLLGKFLVEKANSPSSLFNLMVAIGFVFSLVALLSVVLNILEGGFVQLERDVPMLWGGAPPAATAMATYFLFNMCIPAVLVSRTKEMNNFVKVLLLVIFLISVYCVLRLGSRTQLLITLFTLAASVLFIVTKQSARRNIVLFGGLFILLNIGLNYVNLDSKSDLMTSYASRMDSKKYGAGTAGGRTERWAKSLNNLVEKPFGWSLDEFGYAHNLWFDVLRVTGIIPFFLLVIFSVRSILNTKRAITANPNNVAISNLFLVYMLAIFLQFLVEPIFDGIYHLFVFFCLLQGVINGYAKKFVLKPMKT